MCVCVYSASSEQTCFISGQVKPSLSRAGTVSKTMRGPVRDREKGTDTDTDTHFTPTHTQIKRQKETKREREREREREFDGLLLQTIIRNNRGEPIN